MDLRKQFECASNEICINLGIDADLDIKYHETPNIGIDYVSYYRSDSKNFSFHLRIDAEGENPFTGKMTASFSYDFDSGLAPFFFLEDITHQRIHPNYLCRWVFWAIYNYRLTHETLRLDSVFHDSIIRVYGTPDIGLGREFDIISNGILVTQKEPVICYKIGHIQRDDNYRDLSYALLLQSDWWFFPNCVGMDSGGAGWEYKRMEEFLDRLSSIVDLEIRRVDIDYEELKYFLLVNSENFSNLYREESRMVLTFWDEPSYILEDSPTQYVSFQRRFDQREYPEALRDLRAMLQYAQERVLLKSEITLPETPNINNLAHLLVRERLVSGRLLNWFLAFVSYANISSHGPYPSPNDMQSSSIRKRVFLTFRMGLFLLNELDEVYRNLR